MCSWEAGNPECQVNGKPLTQMKECQQLNPLMLSIWCLKRASLQHQSLIFPSLFEANTSLHKQMTKIFPSVKGNGRYLPAFQSPFYWACVHHHNYLITMSESKTAGQRSRGQNDWFDKREGMNEGILVKNLLPSVKAWKMKFISLHVNIPKPITQVLMEWLLKNHSNILEGSSQSLDLNPEENLWREWKIYVAKHQNSWEDLHGRMDQNSSYKANQVETYRKPLIFVINNQGYIKY